MSERPQPGCLDPPPAGPGAKAPSKRPGGAGTLPQGESISPEDVRSIGAPGGPARWGAAGPTSTPGMSEGPGSRRPSGAPLPFPPGCLDPPRRGPARKRRPSVPAAGSSCINYRINIQYPPVCIPAPSPCPAPPYPSGEGTGLDKLCQRAGKWPSPCIHGFLWKCGRICVENRPLFLAPVESGGKRPVSSTPPVEAADLERERVPAVFPKNLYYEYYF